MPPPNGYWTRTRQAVEPDEFCEPLERVKIGAETLDLNPCGLIANSMFNGEGKGQGGEGGGGWALFSSC